MLFYWIDFVPLILMAVMVHFSPVKWILRTYNITRGTPCKVRVPTPLLGLRPCLSTLFNKIAHCPHPGFT